MHYVPLPQTQANTRNPLPTKPVNKPHPQRAAEDRICAGAVLYSPKGTGQQNNLTSPQEGQVGLLPG